MAIRLPTLDRLRALREVARTGRFSAAADALALTQPAVSNQIRQLEQELGAKLLERIGKTARPTPEGEILITAASRAFTELETAMSELARMRAEIKGNLVLAAGATAIRYLLPPVMADLRARHPAIECRVLSGNTNDLIPGIVEGSIDLGLLTASALDPRLRSKFFFRDQLVCITPTAEAPAPRRLRPRDLEERQLVLFDRGGSIRHAIDAWLDAADRSRIRVTDIGSADAHVAFVRAGFGWSIISEIVAREDATAGLVDLLGLDPPLSRDLVLVWRADRTSRPIISAALAVFASHAMEPD